jgi:hypothetical protein
MVSAFQLLSNLNSEIGLGMLIQTFDDVENVRSLSLSSSMYTHRACSCWNSSSGSSTSLAKPTMGTMQEEQRRAYAVVAAPLAHG